MTEPLDTNSPEAFKAEIRAQHARLSERASELERLVDVTIPFDRPGYDAACANLASVRAALAILEMFDHVVQRLERLEARAERAAPAILDSFDHLVERLERLEARAGEVTP